MRAWLRQHRQAIGSAFARFPRTAGMLSAIVIGVALSLPAGGYTLLEGLRTLGSRVSLEPQISLFLRPELKRPEAEKLSGTLKNDSRIARVRFIAREEALAELKSVQGMSEVIAALGRNPLPDTYVVQARDPAPERIEALAADLAKLPGVAQVQADSAWAQRLAALGGVLRSALWLVAAVLGLGLVAVTFNTVRLQIVTQREEIEVSKLIGATDAFIRRPFYYLGLLQGVAGGLVAVGIVAAGVGLLNRQVTPLAASYGSSFRIALLGAGDTVAIILFAGLIGWLGAWLSVSRQLEQIDPG